jgi:hypothetical protein
MRHFVGLGLLLLVVSACAHIPDHIKVEVDGSTVEVIKAPIVTPAGDDQQR